MFPERILDPFYTIAARTPMELVPRALSVANDARQTACHLPDYLSLIRSGATRKLELGLCPSQAGDGRSRCYRSCRRRARAH